MREETSGLMKELNILRTEYEEVAQQQEKLQNKAEEYAKRLEGLPQKLDDVKNSKTRLEDMKKALLDLKANLAKNREIQQQAQVVWKQIFYFCYFVGVFFVLVGAKAKNIYISLHLSKQEQQQLKDNLQHATDKLKDVNQNYNTLKNNATQQLNDANVKMERTKATIEADIFVHSSQVS